MKTGSIIRGCILNEDAKKESELIEERVTAKVNEITSVAKEHCNSLLEVFAEEMHKKIGSLDKYKEELQSEYKIACEKNNEQNSEIIKELEDKYLKVLKEQEKTMNLFIENAQDSVKELMLILFEKFFYTEYKKPENLISIIKEGLKQLEDSKKVQISLNERLLSEITDSEIEQIKTLSSAELLFNSHSSDSLLLELKSEQNNIEVDFNKQIEKIKDVIYSF